LGRILKNIFNSDIIIVQGLTLWYLHMCLQYILDLPLHPSLFYLHSFLENFNKFLCSIFI
jgi:hypothetical protein